MTRKNLKSVEFSCVAPKAKSVSVAGTFNDWNPEATPLSFATNGKWSTKLKLAPGRHEFKFIVDREWCCERKAEFPSDHC